MLKKIAIATVPAMALGAALLLTSTNSAKAVPMSELKAVTPSTMSADADNPTEESIQTAGGRGFRGGFRGGRRGGFRRGFRGGFRRGFRGGFRRGFRGGFRHFRGGYGHFRGGWGGYRYHGGYGGYRFGHWGI